MRIPQVLSTLGFFFGDPGTPDALWEPKNCQLLCAVVRVAGTADADRCFACVCCVSFVTAVPEKLKVLFVLSNIHMHHFPLDTPLHTLIKPPSFSRFRTTRSITQ